MTTLIPVSSSWVIVDGVVWAADSLPRLSKGNGPSLNKTREMIRASIAAKFGRK